MLSIKFIADNLDRGYSTPIGERGVRLSGGQRQRIGIARALYYDPEILIFDEATSALDSHSENAIMDAIFNVAAGHTSLIIAHRLSTVQTADRIVVLDNGKVVEQGTHSDLLARNGAYASLWQAQKQLGA